MRNRPRQPSGDGTGSRRIARACGRARAPTRSLGESLLRRFKRNYESLIHYGHDVVPLCWSQFIYWVKSRLPGRILENGAAVTWFCTKLDQVTWICKIMDQVTWSSQFAQGQITWFLEFEGQVTWIRKIVDQVTWETKM